MTLYTVIAGPHDKRCTWDSASGCPPTVEAFPNNDRFLTEVIAQTKGAGAYAETPDPTIDWGNEDTVLPAMYEEAMDVCGQPVLLVNHDEPDDEYEDEDESDPDDNAPTPMQKFDDYHDERGRFSSSEGGSMATISTPEAATSWEGQHYGSGWQDSMSPESKAALKVYTGFGYSVINLSQRGTPEELAHSLQQWGDDPTKGPRLWAKQADDIHAAMKPVPQDLTVWRGIDAMGFPGGDNSGHAYDWNTVAGTDFKDKGFPSTSLLEKIGRGWAFKGAVAKIEVPKGTPAIAIQPFAANPALGEHELLLDRGLKFHIDKVTWEDDQMASGGKRAVLHMKVVK